MHRARHCLAALLLAITAQAALAALSYVSDEVLASQRGRYLNAGTIFNFGITLVSTWRDNTQVSGVATQLVRQADGQLQQHNYQLAGGSPASGGGSTSIPGGLSGVQGVVQVNQQSGNGNRSNNATVIQIAQGQAVSLSLGEQWQQTGSSTGSGNQLSISLDQGSQGWLKQSIGNGQIGQYAHITGNHVQVDNQLRIVINTRPEESARSSLQHLLQMQRLTIGLPR